MRIGLIADTHMPGSLKDLWPQAMAAFEGVDCILHAGDLHTLDIVDALNRIAPVYVAKGNGDMDLVDPRLRDVWQLELGGLAIGMIHQLPSPERRGPTVLRDYTARHFAGGAPRVVIYGHTHLECTHLVDGVLYVNPGSPTLPRNQSLRLGTLGLLEITQDTRSGAATAVTTSIYQLSEHGWDAHQDIAVQRLSVADDGQGLLTGDV